MAGKGLEVTAVDRSVAMVEQARSKLARAGHSESVRCLPMDLDKAETALDNVVPNAVGHITGALSNFGVFNCLSDRPALARALASRLPAGAPLAVVVMGRWCPWEICSHAIRGDLRRGFRRLASSVTAEIAGGPAFRVDYPNPRRLASDLMPGFRLRRTVALGVLVPPSYLSHWVDRWPRVFRLAARLEVRLAGTAPVNRWGDHFLALFERTSGSSS